jgi:glutamate synthase domain-containing protein 3
MDGKESNMKKPNTIETEIRRIQEAIALILPDMDVTVSINMTRKKNPGETPIVKGVVWDDAEVTADPVDDKPPMDLEQVKSLLNAYVRSAGKDKALELVKKYSNGSDKPADIDPADYHKLIADMDGTALKTKGAE